MEKGQSVELLNQSQTKIEDENNENWHFSAPTPEQLTGQVLKPLNQDSVSPTSPSIKIIPSKDSEIEGLLPQSKSVREFERTPPPLDRFYLTYFIILIHGIAVLLSWNMIITAGSYFTAYKLNTTISEDTDYRKSFLIYVIWASQIPQFLFSFINLFVHFGGSLTKRIVYSVSIMIVLYMLMVVLALVDSSSWPYEFFIITMCAVALMNACNGVYQNSIFGVAGQLPERYSNAVILGNNISGTLCAVIMLISKWSSPDLRTSGIVYFVAVLLVLIIAFNSYFLLPYLKFYFYYQKLHKLHHKNESGVQEKQTFAELFGELWSVFLEIKLQCFNIWFLFFVTLSMFPAVISTVTPRGEFFISKDYFALVTCYLFFNVFAMIGNVLPNFFLWPGPKNVVFPILLRALFIPFFMLSNSGEKRRESAPVWFENEWTYIIGVIIFSLSSGYYSSLPMMYAPGEVINKKHKSKAGQVSAFFLIFGVFSGSMFSKLWVFFLEKP